MPVRVHDDSVAVERDFNRNRFKKLQREGGDLRTTVMSLLCLFFLLMSGHMSWMSSKTAVGHTVAGVQYHGVHGAGCVSCSAPPPSLGRVHRMHQAAPSPLLPFSGTLGKRFMLTYHHSECSATAYSFIRVK